MKIRVRDREIEKRTVQGGSNKTNLKWNRIVKKLEMKC